MTKKNRIFRHILMWVTILLPTSLYIFVAALMFGVEPDYNIHDAEFGDLTLLIDEDDYFIASDNQAAIFDGIVAYNAQYDKYVLHIRADDIISISGELYHIKEGALVVLDIKELKQQTKTSSGISAASLIAVAIIAVVMIRKFKLGAKYPRIAVMVSLLIGTGILYGINAVIGDMLAVFAVATASWAAYLIQYTWYYLKLTDAERAEKIRKAEAYGR